MDRRIVKTKEAIRQAYFDLLVENSDKRITVTNIADRANIDRKTFYLHYDSPEAIIKELGNEKITELQDILGETIFFKNPLHIDLLFTSIQKLLEKDLETLRIIASNANLAFFWDEICAIGEKAIINAYENKVNVSKSELQFYARFFCVGLIDIYKKLLVDKDYMDLEVVTRSVIKLANKGIMGIFV